MSGSRSDSPKKPFAAGSLQKPLAILAINKKEEEEKRKREAEAEAAKSKLEKPQQPSQTKPSSGLDAPDPLAGLSMDDLLGPADQPKAKAAPQAQPAKRVVDDFDFDEEAFLAALDENEPVGATGDVVPGLSLIHI